jgi:hypothetical protein
MSNENLTPPNLPTIPEMLRVTGGNTAQFMEQVALHIEKLENEVFQLRARVEELEKTSGTE